MNNAITNRMSAVAPNNRLPTHGIPLVDNRAPPRADPPKPPNWLGVGGAAIGGVLLAASGFPGVGYLCLGATAFSALVIALFMRQARP